MYNIYRYNTCFPKLLPIVVYAVVARELLTPTEVLLLHYYVGAEKKI